ncbi:MAG TPA: hypothetical protein VGX23_00380 [Actinocrinis sp.]|nr:hypothetical protein [Actinocrinis sp.]
MQSTRHLYRQIDGHTVFYREAGPADAPAVVLLHGAPASSHMFREYPTNVELYPQVHQYFRDSRVPLLAVWGRNDENFGPDGATAFTHDLPDAEVHLIDGGHFLLESRLDTVAGYIQGFLGRVLGNSKASAGA